MRPFLAPIDSSVVPAAPPTFSVVIAAYQAATTIGDAIESALRQTSPPLEIVICDDGSTDDLDSALARYRDEIVLVRNESNRGEASAKNAAVRAASGQFVALLDADDVYFPDRLEALGELAAARPDLDILTSDAYLELDGTRLRRCYTEAWTFEVGDQRRAILERNFILGLAAVRRSRVLSVGGFDEEIRWTTDWDLWARLILDGSRAGAVAEPLALYRLGAASLSADRRRLIAGRLQTLQKAARHPTLNGAERQTVAAAIAREQRELALIELKHALVRGAHRRRRHAFRLLCTRGLPVRTRLKAGAALVAPGVVGRLLERREAGVWIAAGGTRLKLPAPAAEAQQPVPR
jgi:GT2 family glycosyltransferase